MLKQGSQEDSTFTIALRKDTDDLETQVYIVAGVLGGACLLLLICVFILTIYAINLSKRVKAAEEKRRIADEMNRRKFSAYTGEEVRRNLQSAIPITTPAPESEYAFNYTASEYKLQPTGR